MHVYMNTMGAITAMAVGLARALGTAAAMRMQQKPMAVMGVLGVAELAPMVADVRQGPVMHGPCMAMDMLMPMRLAMAMAMAKALGPLQQE